MKLFFRKNFFTILWAALLILVLFSSNAKAFFLKTLLHTGFFNATAKKENNPLQTAALESLSFTDNKGIRLNTAGLKGKVVFINFWATWCPPCIAEMGSVNALYNKLKDDPRFVFIIADVDNNNFNASGAFMGKHQYHLPVYQSASSVPGNLFTGTIPTTLIIDSKGNLVQRHEGIANYDTKDMLDFLRSL